MILPTLSLGGVGVVSVLANIIPEKVTLMVNLCLEQQYLEARELYYRYHLNIKTLFIETNPIPIKEIMSQREMLLNNYRLPLVKSKFPDKIRDIFDNV